MSQMEEPEKKRLIVDETDGIRLKSMKESINYSVDKLLDTWKESLFKKCFPTFSRSNKEAVQQIREGMLSVVRDAIFTDIDGIIDDDVKSSLNKLDKLILEYSGPKDIIAWRPTGEPVNDALPHDIKVLEYEKEKLLGNLAEAKQKTKHLYNKVQEGRDEFHSNNNLIKKRRQKLEEVVQLGQQLEESKIDYMVTELTNKE